MTTNVLLAFATRRDGRPRWLIVTTTGCWLWTGALDPDGYGRHLGKMAHRAVWEMARGPIRPGYEIDHLCRVRCCTNPDHLEAVTPPENRRRARAIAELKALCLRGHDQATHRRTMSTGRRYCTLCDRARHQKSRVAG